MFEPETTLPLPSPPPTKCNDKPGNASKSSSSLNDAWLDIATGFKPGVKTHAGIKGEIAISSFIIEERIKVEIIQDIRTLQGTKIEIHGGKLQAAGQKGWSDVCGGCAKNMRTYVVAVEVSKGTTADAEIGLRLW